MSLFQSILKAALQSAVESAVEEHRRAAQQRALQEQMATAQQSNSRTGGPGSWGGTTEDEIARLSAELGIYS